MIVAIDLETTGLDPTNDSIIEVALVKFDEKTFEVVDKYSSLVNPQIEIPELVTNITNISDNDVKNSPKWSEIQVEVEEFIWDNPILWHNVYFDASFLENNHVDLSINVAIDTFMLANSLNLNEKSLSTFM